MLHAEPLQQIPQSYPHDPHALSFGSPNMSSTTVKTATGTAAAPVKKTATAASTTTTTAKKTTAMASATTGPAKPKPSMTQIDHLQSLLISHGFACPHFPKLNAATSSFPSCLAFFDTQDKRKIVYFETNKLCSSCCSKVAPRGFNVWIHPNTHPLAWRGKPEPLPKPMPANAAAPQANTNRPVQKTIEWQLVQAGTTLPAHSASSLATNATPRTATTKRTNWGLFKLPTTVRIPADTATQGAFSWLRRDKRPFFIEQLNATKLPTPWSESVARRDVKTAKEHGRTDMPAPATRNVESRSSQSTTEAPRIPSPAVSTSSSFMVNYTLSSQATNNTNASTTSTATSYTAPPPYKPAPAWDGVSSHNSTPTSTPGPTRAPSQASLAQGIQHQSSMGSIRRRPVPSRAASMPVTDSGPAPSTNSTTANIAAAGSISNTVEPATVTSGPPPGRALKHTLSATLSGPFSFGFDGFGLGEEVLPLDRHNSLPETLADKPRSLSGKESRGSLLQQNRHMASSSIHTIAELSSSPSTASAPSHFSSKQSAPIAAYAMVPPIPLGSPESFARSTNNGGIASPIAGPDKLVFQKFFRSGPIMGDNQWHSVLASAAATTAAVTTTTTATHPSQAIAPMASSSSLSSRFSGSTVAPSPNPGPMAGSATAYNAASPRSFANRMPSYSSFSTHPSSASQASGPTPSTVTAWSPPQSQQPISQQSTVPQKTAKSMPPPAASTHAAYPGQQSSFTQRAMAESKPLPNKSQYTHAAQSSYSGSSGITSQKTVAGIAPKPQQYTATTPAPNPSPASQTKPQSSNKKPVPKQHGDHHTITGKPDSAKASHHKHAAHPPQPSKKKAASSKTTQPTPSSKPEPKLGSKPKPQPESKPKPKPKPASKSATNPVSKTSSHAQKEKHHNPHSAAKKKSTHGNKAAHDQSHHQKGHQHHVQPKGASESHHQENIVQHYQVNTYNTYTNTNVTNNDWGSTAECPSDFDDALHYAGRKAFLSADGDDFDPEGTDDGSGMSVNHDPSDDPDAFGSQGETGDWQSGDDDNDQDVEQPLDDEDNDDQTRWQPPDDDDDDFAQDPSREIDMGDDGDVQDPSRGSEADDDDEVRDPSHGFNDFDDGFNHTSSTDVYNDNDDDFAAADQSYSNQWGGTSSFDENQIDHHTSDMYAEQEEYQQGQEYQSSQQMQGGGSYDDYQAAQNDYGQDNEYNGDGYGPGYNHDDAASQASYDGFGNNTQQDHDNGQEDYDNDQQDYENSHQGYDNSHDGYNNGHEDYNNGHEDYNNGHEDYNNGHEDYNNGHEDYNPGNDQDPDYYNGGYDPDQDINHNNDDEGFENNQGGSYNDAFNNGGYSNDQYYDHNQGGYDNQYHDYPGDEDGNQNGYNGDEDDNHNGYQGDEYDNQDNYPAGEEVDGDDGDNGDGDGGDGDDGDDGGDGDDY
ncbi:hypothetical protein VHEMI01293 [[Torrubiella] hemipterigena]|uniref:Uncharacterized protein n=1 Tax=[Torrubiella] hemipterigena TaxID=1531966 RepID=A0A0A1SLK7_9HYPO|nr:hypothetical protein VHEMI01293 [[Torrubiella] hemipterigena]